MIKNPLNNFKGFLLYIKLLKYKYEKFKYIYYGKFNKSTN